MEEQARSVMHAKTKPEGSLGLLEDWAVRLSTCTQPSALEKEPTETPVLCHAVTSAVFESIGAGIAACCVLSRSADASIHLEDVGMATSAAAEAPQPPAAASTAAPSDSDRSSFTSEQPQNALRAQMLEPRTERVGARPDIVVARGRIREGTRDMVIEAAMQEWELEAALQRGAEAAQRAEQEGVKVLCAGEIGIGNTTAAAALLSALTGSSAEAVTGKGTGVDDEGLRVKRAAVAAAVQRAQHSCELRLKVPEDSVDELGTEGVNRKYATAMLREVGGLEIAAMAGAMMHAKQTQMTVLVDGFISGVAALAAVMVDNGVAAALLLTHRSEERGAEVLLCALRRCGVLLGAPLSMGMRLGEGSGALLALPMLKGACDVMRDMGTLADTLALVGMGPAGDE